MIRRVARTFRRRMRLLYHAGQAALGAHSVGDAALMKALNAPDADALTAMLRAKQLKFFFVAEEKHNLAEQFLAAYPDSSRAVLVHADAACRHEFTLLGARTNRLSAVESQQSSIAISWHEDFGTGRRWKKRFSALLPVQCSDESDIKRVWELSRCQHFGALGIAHVCDGVLSRRDHRAHRDSPLENDGPDGCKSSSSETSAPSVAESPYAVEFVAEMLDWDRENPPLIGPNWLVPMEAAIRIVNWIWGYAFMGDSPAFGGQTGIVLYRNLLSHGRFILRHLEGYGNHRFSNFVGLVWLGVLFPEFKESGEWREVGMKGFCEELRKQVRPDGCHFEGSIPYHRLVLEMAATTWLLLRRNGIELPDDAQAAITRMFEFTAAYLPGPVREASGRRFAPFAPQVGDADDGRLQELTPLDKRDHSYLLSLAAVLTGRSEFKISEKPHPEAFWILGEDGLRTYDALPTLSHRDHREHRDFGLAKDGLDHPKTLCSVVDAVSHSNHKKYGIGVSPVLSVRENPLCPLCSLWQKSVAFPESGFYVLRSDRLHVFVSCRRPDPLDTGAHIHNDHLSFTLALDGLEFLVDSGTYTYTGNLQTRNEFRSTVAHNTIMVDGEEINPLPRNDPFRLRDEADCRVIEWRTSNAEDAVTACHDGYIRLGVKVQRQFTLDKSESVLRLRDTVSGRGKHRLEWRFHFAPEVKLELDGGELLATRDGHSLRISLPGMSDAGAVMHSAILPSWYSPSYGAKQRNNVAVISMTSDIPTTIAIRFVPSPQSSVPSASSVAEAGTAP